jgi:prephenate dehydrogenase
MISSSGTEPPRSVAVLGTGLIGTSIALAATRAGIAVSGWDADPTVAAVASGMGALEPADDLAGASAGADLIVVCTPLATVADVVAAALDAAPDAVVTDVGSVKEAVLRDVAERRPGSLDRYVPGHPMGGGERTGPERASASVVDAIVWVLAPDERAAPSSVAVVEAFIGAVGARPVRLDPQRHDKLVAFVSHLPQVASTALMGLAATEEADEPDILLLAAGGFRDLTRLAASNPELWSQILLANGPEIARAIDLYVERLRAIRRQIDDADAQGVGSTFETAKAARLRLAAKPQVRAGVAVIQVAIPDEPGALARITAVLGAGGVNIEDLQIVHSPEGGRGTVHLTIAADAAVSAADVLVAGDYDPVRLA